MTRISLALAMLVLGCATIAFGASKQASGPNSPAPSGSTAQGAAHDDATDLLEGEQRFRTNCGRCHQPPHKLPPRMMATIIRHMRVRAMLTDEDMRLILKYMTQ